MRTFLGIAPDMNKLLRNALHPVRAASVTTVVSMADAKGEISQGV